MKANWTFDNMWLAQTTLIADKQRFYQVVQITTALILDVLDNLTSSSVEITLQEAYN